MSLTILKSFSLDFAKAPPLEHVFAKQGDQNSRILEITPLNNGAVYPIPEGTTARFGALKPDGTQILDDATIDDGKIYVTLSGQALAVSGIVIAEVTLYGSSNELLSSQHFYIKVESFAIDPDAAESSDEYKSFETALQEADNLNIISEMTAKGSKITITDKEGITHTVYIRAGATECNGKQFTLNASEKQSTTAHIESSSTNVDIWQYEENLLPPAEPFSLCGVDVTVEPDGTLVFNGTTNGNGAKTIAMNALPCIIPKNGFTNYYLSWQYSAAAPNMAGYVMFKVLDNQNRNGLLVSANSSTALSGSSVALQSDMLSLNTFQIQFYNVPSGTVFNNWKAKLKAEVGIKATKYTKPSLSHRLLVIAGSDDIPLELAEGTNNIITSADKMSFPADIVIENGSYAGKRWACFGDSLTQKDVNAVNAGQLRYFDIVSKQLGLSVVNYGRATTGYSTSGSVTNGAYYTRMQNINPDVFDFMTIMGSTNDIGGLAQGTIQLGDYDDTGTSTVCGCINTTLDYYYSLAPLKPIGMISMLPSYAYGPDLIDTTTAENYVNAQKQICANRGIPFLDLYHGSGMRPWIDAVKSALYIEGDGIHPNNEGIKWFAPMIREFIKTLM